MSDSEIGGENGLRASSAEPVRLLFVHAHPDDETLTTGATMARYAAEGGAVALVTCTRGEKGEVIGPLGYLEGDDDALAAHRSAELAEAMAALGVTDHQFLGEQDGVRFRDSGMVWGPDWHASAPPELAPDAFAAVDAQVAARHLVPVVLRVRPHYVITYDPRGGYGHPDHVQAHRVALAAVRAAAERWSVEDVLEVAVPLSAQRAGEHELGERGLDCLHPPWPPVVVDDAQVSHTVEAESYLARKVAALRAHATQVVLGQDGTTYALSNGLWHPLRGTEWFRRTGG